MGACSNVPSQDSAYASSVPCRKIRHNDDTPPEPDSGRLQTEAKSSTRAYRSSLAASPPRRSRRRQRLTGLPSLLRLALLPITALGGAAFATLLGASAGNLATAGRSRGAAHVGSIGTGSRGRRAAAVGDGVCGRRSVAEERGQRGIGQRVVCRPHGGCAACWGVGRDARERVSEAG